MHLFIAYGDLDPAGPPPAGAQTIALDHEAIVYLFNDDGDVIGQFKVADVGRTGECFRCGSTVTGQLEVAFIDRAGRNDCAESADGAPCEIDEPE